MNCLKNLTDVQPFLKWAGGKRWLTKQTEDIFPDKNTYTRYIEPFLGSGAIFFHLNPNKAILSDVNKELIETYNVVKKHYHEVNDVLSKYQKKHSIDYYYKIRNDIPKNEVDRAARFIYLNRTCWNGLYRVNNKGMFNVPKGTKEKVLLNTDNFSGVAKRLSKIIIKNQDFEKAINVAKTNDFIFVDPPYTVKHDKNGFIQYNEKLFSWEDQIRLRNSVKRAISRGAKILVTNANHKSIHELYDGIGEFIILSRSNVLASDPEKRGKFKELMIKCGY